MKLLKILLPAILLFSCSATIEENNPRGLRNNNPGNIVQTDINWEGEVKCNDEKFECFSSPRYGIRAMGVLLSTYYHEHNLVFVSDVLHRWMPPHENQTSKWVEFVRQACSKENTIRLHSLVGEVIYIENGVNPFTTEEIKNAIPTGSRYDVRFRCTERSDEIDGDEEGTGKSQGRDGDEDGRKESGRQTVSQGDKEQRYSMDPPYYCYYNCSVDYRYSEVGGDFLSESPNYFWMDPLRSGFPLLFGRKCHELEDGNWRCDNAPRHPSSFIHYWAIFWRKYCRAQPINNQTFVTELV